MLEDFSLRSMDVIYVNPKEASISDDPGLSTPIAFGNMDAIRERIRGLRAVFTFSVLGGFSGTESTLDVATVAREEGCKVVSFVGIPMQFENERRQRAFEALDDILDVTDRLVIFDMGAVVSGASGNPKFRQFIKVSEYATIYALECLAQLIEGPFFSTFVEKVYTFSYMVDMDPAVAVDSALGASVFPTDPALAKIIVFVSSDFGPAQTERIFDTVVSKTGITPDIVKREDRDDTRVAVFLPVNPDSFPKVCHHE